MNKDALILSLAHKLDTSKVEAKHIFESVIELITDEVKNDNKISIVGFGSFSVKTRKPRRGRNPKTGETIQLPETKRVAFSPSKQLNKEVG